jgi:methylated-DNA-[protein]-cysteine S-methyltransferase
MSSAERITLTLTEVASPIGAVLCAADDTGLCAIEFADRREQMLAGLRRRFGDTSMEAGDPFGAAARLRAYFAGDLGAIDALPVSLTGTAFQRAVWLELRRIPAGATIAYRELAARCGHPAAVRAAGHANGRNPVSIVIPCHRAIGADGSLTGYGGGIERKRWLLAHEGAISGGAGSAS